MGDEKFLEFLRSKNVFVRKFPSTLEIETEIFSLIHEFLTDKPDDYLEHHTRLTTPVFVGRTI